MTARTSTAWDMRLVPTASVALGTTLAVGRIESNLSAAVGVCALCAATAGAVIAFCWVENGERTETSTGRSVGRQTGRFEQLLMLAVCCLTAAVVSGLGSLNTMAHDRNILAGSEPVRATVTLDVRAIPRMAAGGTVVINAGVVEVGKGQRTWTMRTAATVFASGEEWLWLEPGTRVRSVMTTGSGHDPEILLTPISTPQVIRGPTGLYAMASSVRTNLHTAAEGLPRPADSLLPSMVLGDQRKVPEELGENFLASGLSHLAAVSGANIAYVLGATLFLMSWFGAARRARLVVGATAVAAFVCVVGPEPSVMRAGAMAAISVYAMATGRSRQSLALLAAVVLVFSVASPDTVRTLGFILSVAATAGIVIAASPCERLLAGTMRGAGAILEARWCRFRGVAPRVSERPGNGSVSRRWPTTILSGLVALAVVAHLSTAPILAATGRAVSPWAIAKNIAVAPVVPWVTVAGTAAAAIAPAAPPVARLLAWTCVPSLWWTATVAGFGEDASGRGDGVGGER